MRTAILRLFRTLHHAVPEPLKGPVRRAYLEQVYWRLFPELASPTDDAPESKAPQLSVDQDDRARPAIVCLPIIAWRYRIQRPQHLLVRLAARGYRVVYVEPALDGAPYSRRPRPRWTRPLSEHVTGLKLPLALGLDIYRDTPDPTQIARMADALEKGLDGLGVGEATLFVQLPFWSGVARRVAATSGWGLVYDCLDEHAGFSNTAPDMLAGEASLMRDADVVLVTSQALLDKARGIAGRVEPVPNGCDVARFADPTAPDQALAAQPRPVLGYVGAITDWFATELVVAAARAWPRSSVVLVGRADDDQRRALEAAPNIRLLGEQDHARLPALLAAMDVALIPFRRTPLTLAAQPVKLFEYLASGLPVVSTRLPEVEPFSEWVRFGDTPDEFVAAIRTALDDPQEMRDQRRAAVRAHDWTTSARAADEAIRDAGPRASIIVVTWNGWLHTRACLEALFRCMPPSRSEVIIVDNASSDGTRAGLLGYACQHPELRVVANSDNRGFAAATNQGLRMARGDLLVLLNNDTVVTPGWLRRLARWLEDPAIGLVGPVTNWAGNEARIAADYSDLAGLHAFAADRGRRHARRGFDIEMLAMYCLAMRRDVFERVGELDERFEVGLFEDDDYARRVHDLGLRVVCAEDTFVHHVGRASFGTLAARRYKALFARNRARFEAKWGGPWMGHRSRTPATARDP